MNIWSCSSGTKRDLVETSPLFHVRVLVEPVNCTPFVAVPLRAAKVTAKVPLLPPRRFTVTWAAPVVTGSLVLNVTEVKLAWPGVKLLLTMVSTAADWPRVAPPVTVESSRFTVLSGCTIEPLMIGMVKVWLTTPWLKVSVPLTLV